MVGYIPLPQVVFTSCRDEVDPSYSKVFIFVLVKIVVKLSSVGQEGCREGSHEQFFSGWMNFFQLKIF